MRERQLWSTEKTINALDRQPFGKRLASQLADQLHIKAKARWPGNGMYNQHRDYCGHGLLYIDGAYHLLKVNDGIPERRDSIAHWNDKEAFVAFWAQQSDFTCSGADPGAGLFYTDDYWTLNNQRISRDRIQQFITPAARARDR